MAWEVGFYFLNAGEKADYWFSWGGACGPTIRLGRLVLGRYRPRSVYYNKPSCRTNPDWQMDLLGDGAKTLVQVQWVPISSLPEEFHDLGE